MTTLIDRAKGEAKAALAITDYNAKRSALQRAFRPLFDEMFGRSTLAAIHHDSEFIADGTISMTAAPSNFLQRMHPDVIVWAIVNYEADAGYVKSALRAAFLYKAETKGHDSFGYPGFITKTIAQSAKDKLLMTTTATINLASTSLAAMVNIIDELVARGNAEASVKEALKDNTDPKFGDLISAAYSLIEVRGERADKPELSAADALVVEALHDLLNGVGAEPEEEAEPVRPKRAPLAMPTPEHATMIDSVLKVVGLPSIHDIIARANEEGSDPAIEKRLLEEVGVLKRKLAAAPVIGPITVAHHGSLPSGAIEVQKAYDVFDVASDPKRKAMLDFDVPVGKWDAPHPHVPELDPDYMFMPSLMIPLLLAISGNGKPWLRGHTGTGKTTLVEQVYARLGLPLYRVNLDSDITRSELVGRDTIKQDAEGRAVSQFIEGIIPRVMQEPCGLLLDEVDASRPDLGFVLQRLTEGRGFMLLEDGGRTIMPHPWFRIFATANTNGRGDETGLYTGTRVLGSAFVNRFGPFLTVDYIDAKSELKLIQAKAPGLAKVDAEKIVKYAKEHRIAFGQAQVSLPCSPRDTVAMAKTLVSYLQVFPVDEARKLAFDHTVGNAADGEDVVVLKGLADRTIITK